MYRLLLLLFLSLLSAQVHATLITISYEIDFTEYGNTSSGYNIINDTPVYHDEVTQGYYLNNIFDLTVMYDTDVQGYYTDSTKHEVPDTSTKDFFLAEIVSTNILLDSGKPRYYNWATQDIDLNDSINHFFSTTLSNEIHLISDKGRIDQMLIDDLLKVSMSDHSDTVGTWILDSGETFCCVRGYDYYNGFAQVTSIETISVPEPSILALFSLGLLGFGYTRRKTR